VQTIKINAIVETDGELRVSNLPCRKGDHVEGLLVLPDHVDDAASGQRKAARDRFLRRARSVVFRSTRAYPSRDELHERDMV